MLMTANPVRCAAACLFLVVIARCAPGQQVVRGWGSQVFDSSWESEAFVEISARGAPGACVASPAGGRSSLPGRADASVVGWGESGLGECSIPPPPSTLAYVEI